MTYLLDTSSFSDLMRENPAVVRRLSSLSAQDTVLLCPIVRGEIAYGLKRLPEGQRRSVLEAKAEKLFGAFLCHEVTAAAAERYAQLKVVRQKKGLSLDENDLWIAAVALSLGATLITRDGDFREIDDLPVQNWAV
jgi:predicted nucleic acid-binding protein